MDLLDVVASAFSNILKISDFQKMTFRKNNLMASPLPPAPLAVAGFLVAGLVSWQYSDRPVGL